jgi:hypothetical protein
VGVPLSGSATSFAIAKRLSEAAQFDRYVADLGATLAIVGIKSGHGVISIENDRVLVSAIKIVKKIEIDASLRNQTTKNH